jgi:hypothetical protein
LEQKQRQQLIDDRRHATALIQAHDRGESFLSNMEERARLRLAMKTEREAKRRAIEEEKLAKVQRKHCHERG